MRGFRGQVLKIICDLDERSEDKVTKRLVVILIGRLGQNGLNKVFISKLVRLVLAKQKAHFTCTVGFAASVLGMQSRPVAVRIGEQQGSFFGIPMRPFSVGLSQLFSW